MVAPGLTVGGWFAGVVIANFVGKVRSIMEDHHGLRAAAGDMLYNVEGALPLIKILVEVTERKAISNRNFAAWLQQFKDVVSEAEDLLDDFETKRIQEMLKSKVSSAARGLTLQGRAWTSPLSRYSTYRRFFLSARRSTTSP
ncbi:hypothetical protein ACQ4PT_037594 [Festuca glaucescens]